MMLSNERDVVLEENCSYDEDPTQEEVEEYARLINVDPETEKNLMYIAHNGIRASLPENWKPILQKNGQLYYFNFLTNENSWEHPCDQLYRKMAENERFRLKNKPPIKGEGTNGHSNHFKNNKLDLKIDSSNDSSFLTLHDLKNDSDCTQSGSNEKSSQITQLFTTPMASPKLNKKENNSISEQNCNQILNKSTIDDCLPQNLIYGSSPANTAEKNSVNSETNEEIFEESPDVSVVENQHDNHLQNGNSEDHFSNGKNMPNNYLDVINHSEKMFNGTTNSNLYFKLGTPDLNKIPPSIMKSYESAEKSLEAKWQKYQKLGSVGFAKVKKKQNFSLLMSDEYKIMQEKVQKHKNWLRGVQEDIERHLSRS